MSISSGITWRRDIRPAAWLAERLHAFGQDVGSIVPEGFAAYCRILHPAGESGERWSDIARRNGRVVHPEVQFHMICRPVGVPASDDNAQDDLAQPARGSLPPTERQVLIETLRTETSTPDRCWFCMWEGWGDLDFLGVTERIHLPQRSYLLYEGAIDTALARPPRIHRDRAVNARSGHGDRCPNLWWPDDLAWIVATEVDFSWTYVGGTQRLIEALLLDQRLEALPARLIDSPFHDSDVINAALDRPS